MKKIRLILSFLLAFSMLAGCSKKTDAGNSKTGNGDETTDIVVVGGGGAGMAAALEANSRGMNVILLEKLSEMGGTTLSASTAVNAGGSSVQMKGLKPSSVTDADATSSASVTEEPKKDDDTYTERDFYNKLNGHSDKEDPSLKNLAVLSGKMVDWLIDMGADLGTVINGSQHITSDGSAMGTMLVPVLVKNLDDTEIDYRTDNDVTDIIMDGDKVVGVVVESSHGEYKIHAKAVVLATGSFASNPEMVAKYTPQWAGYPSTASRGATGDGITMALKAGAALGNMENAGPQCVAYDTGNGAISLTNARYNGAILVNRDGKRFVNELTSTPVVAKAITGQTDGYAYLIFDQVSVDRAILMQEYKDAGYFTEAQTLKELGRALGIDGSELETSVETYRDYFDKGDDLGFGRTASMFSRIDTPTYYGAKISPASQQTRGGVMIDLKARALREDGTVIDGLYIGGETANQIGNGLTVAFVLGRLAGDTAADDILNK